MRILAVVLLAGAAMTTAAAAPANAQTGDPNQATAAPPPEVTVRAPDRMVCRSVARTATRMRSNRVCRTVAQWDEARAGRSQDEELADAADTLETLGEKVSTNCTGGMGGGHNGPLGPR